MYWVWFGICERVMLDVSLLVLIGVAPFVGSFLGMLVIRLPLGRPVGWARSQCDHCGHKLGVRDLFPVVSWLWLRGRCRYCGASIGSLPLAMEIGALLIAVWAATETTGWILVATCALGWALLALAVIDWRTFLLPDALTLPLIPSGLLVAYLIVPSSLLDHVIAAAVGLLGAIMLTFVYRWLRGRDGLGLGDAKLLAGLGAWVGLAGLPTTLLFAATLGMVFVLVAALSGRRLALSDKIPLGTFLAAGGWLVWLYGPLVPAI
jgi:leader peptidase (prepilin peptidase)/N-methyltransferase